MKLLVLKVRYLLSTGICFENVNVMKFVYKLQRAESCIRPSLSFHMQINIQELRTTVPEVHSTALWLNRFDRSSPSYAIDAAFKSVWWLHSTLQKPEDWCWPNDWLKGTNFSFSVISWRWFQVKSSYEIMLTSKTYQYYKERHLRYHYKFCPLCFVRKRNH